MTKSAGDLLGKVAMVTGAARGQGRAHATTLARHGADVIAVDIAAQIDTVPYPLGTEEELAETAKAVEELDRRVLTVQADVRSQTQLDHAVRRGLAEFGQIDILVANAGIYGITPFWEITDAEWDNMIATNLSGVWRSAKAVAPHMIERGSGSIIMTSSVNGLEPGANYAHYVSAKHGVLGLMRTVALELAPKGIRCNAICPGSVDTEHDQLGRRLRHAGRPLERNPGRPAVRREVLPRAQGHRDAASGRHRRRRGVARIRCSLRSNWRRYARRRGTPSAHRHKPRARGLMSRPLSQSTRSQFQYQGVAR